MVIQDEQRKAILTEFGNLKKRKVLPIPAELESEDRHQFDDVVLGSYGLKEWAVPIRKSLKQMYDIRKSVSDG